MALDPRATELLERFPDQLAEGEEAELRGLAEGNATVAALMEEIGGFDALFDRPAPPDDGDLDGEFVLSELGRRRLDRELRTIAEENGLTDAAPVGRSRPGFPVWAVVAAAVVILGLGVLLRPGPDAPPTDHDEFRMRGDEDAIKAELVVLGPTGPLDGGAAQDATVPVRFQAVVSGAAHLAMLETHGGKTVMLWPVRGAQWDTEGGVSELQPPGQSAEYKPAGPGEATYHLIVADGPIVVPDGPVDPADVEALGPEARVAESFTLTWEAP